jgi:hypothetical protein
MDFGIKNKDIVKLLIALALLGCVLGSIVGHFINVMMK